MWVIGQPLGTCLCARSLAHALIRLAKPLPIRAFLTTATPTLTYRQITVVMWRAGPLLPVRVRTIGHRTTAQVGLRCLLAITKPAKPRCSRARTFISWTRSRRSLASLLTAMRMLTFRLHIAAQVRARQRCKPQVARAIGKHLTGRAVPQAGGSTKRVSMRSSSA